MHAAFRIKGAIYGMLIGDALGKYLRDRELEVSRSTVAQFLARHYLDAGAMSLCTMESLASCEKIDTEDMLNLYHEWYIAGYLSSDGEDAEGRIALSTALRLYNNGMPPDRCGCKDEVADDTGLIRMLPVALWSYANSLDNIVANAHEVTAITNAQSHAHACSALFCLLMRGILLQKKDKVPELLKTHYLEKDMSKYVSGLNDVRDYAGMQKSTNEVRDSFWNAWTAYANNQDDFEAVMIDVLSKGQPSTTALAGAFAGANVGQNDIPQRWLDQLALSDDAQNVIEKFVTATTK